MVSTRSTRGSANDAKQATLEDFDINTGGNSRTNSKQDKQTNTGPVQSKAQNQSRKRKAKQPPSPPPPESVPSDKPEEEGRPRKVPKGSTPSDPVGAARRAAETRRKDPRGGAPEARSKAGQSTSPTGDDVNDSKPQKTKQQQPSQTKSGTEAKPDESDATKATPNSSTPILINRAPILTLFAALVTSSIYPFTPWPTCLSAGAAVATLCAISKGRSIGKYDPPSPEAKSEKKRKREQDKDSAPQVLNVMGFDLPVAPNKDSVLVSGKAKIQSEEALVAKFGGGSEEYEAVKGAMEDALGQWQGNSHELNQKAFGMYERFRPEVPKGGRGWGRKGELSLSKIQEVVGTR